MGTRTFSFLLGFTYGVGLYVVGDWLLFHYYDAPGAAERILEEDS